MPSTTATPDPGRPPVEPYPPQRFPAAGRSHDARGYGHNEGPTGLARYQPAQLPVAESRCGPCPDDTPGRLGETSPPWDGGSADGDQGTAPEAAS
jgi:hypothetical protein